MRLAARQRLENLCFRTKIKTLFRRLREAVDSGEEERISEAHRRLVVLLDRAAARRAIHKNAAARRKSQAARIASGVTTEA